MPTLEVPSKGVTISNSADILRYLYAVNLNNGNVGKFLKPSEEAVRLEKMFDRFAIANRRYVALLQKILFSVYRQCGGTKM